MASPWDAPLLTGTCTIPYIATALTPQNSILNVPWIGCSNQHPDCCPWHIDLQGPLKACPPDYTTISGACCPSSWSIFPSVIAGQTPCFTSVSAMLVPPTAALTNNKIIGNRVFTMRYTLEGPPTGLGYKSVLGIGLGIGLGFLLISALVAIIKYRRWKATEVHRATVYRSQSYVTQDQSPRILQGEMHFAPTPAISRHNTVKTREVPSSVPDCPSPLSQSSGNEWPIVTPPTPIHSIRPMTPMELPGDSFLHAHHPAMRPVPDDIGLELVGSSSTVQASQSSLQSMDRVSSTSRYS